MNSIVAMLLITLLASTAIDGGHLRDAHLHRRLHGPQDHEMAVHPSSFLWNKRANSRSVYHTLEGLEGGKRTGRTRDLYRLLRTLRSSWPAFNEDDVHKEVNHHDKNMANVQISPHY